MARSMRAKKKPFGLRALGNNRDGVGFRSWVTTWIQVPINTSQPTKGLLGVIVICTHRAKEIITEAPSQKRHKTQGIGELVSLICCENQRRSAPIVELSAPKLYCFWGVNTQRRNPFSPSELRDCSFSATHRTHCSSIGGGLCADRALVRGHLSGTGD